MSTFSSENEGEGAEKKGSTNQNQRKESLRTLFFISFAQKEYHHLSEQYHISKIDGIFDTQAVKHKSITYGVQLFKKCFAKQA